MRSIVRASVAALTATLVVAVSSADAQRGRAPGRKARAAAGQRTAEQAREQASARADRLASRLNDLLVFSSTRLGGKRASTTRLSGKDEKSGKRSSIILRQLSRRLDRSLRANETMLRLAIQLGDPQMVPPAIQSRMVQSVGPYREGETVMGMKDAGRRFRSADQAPAKWRRKVQESTRITAALIDLLTQQRDRKLANVMLSEQGEIRLIDPERSFNARGIKPAYRSAFFPGERLGYRSGQRSLRDLPEPAQELVEFLASASPKSLESFYGLKSVEATVLRDRARDVREKGLTRAIDDFVKTLTLKPSR